MIKVEALITFTLARFNEIKNLKRNGQDEPGKLFPGDTFECDEELCGYLTGGNGKGIVAVRVLEITPAEKNKTTAYLKDIKEQNKNKITEAKNIKPPKIVKKKKQA